MAPNKLIDETPQEVPLFLRKTYHMIDSCDASIACWSDDGESFIVKDPTKFQQEIIPQFFKHCKFTSFVRQLNFYSFRKIRYADTLRLDPKLEAETANFWRFRHDKFQRGKPHLLLEIKRMAGPKGGASSNNNNNNKSSSSSSSTTVTPAAALSSSSSVAAANSKAEKEDSAAMKQELNTLKKRIEEMNRNLSQLTSMVQKVTLNSNDGDEEESQKRPAGSKRKSLDLAPLEGILLETSESLEGVRSEPIIPPDADASSRDFACIVPPDEMLSSSMDFDTILPMDTVSDEPVFLNPFVDSTLTGGGHVCDDDALGNIDTLSAGECEDAALIDISLNDPCGETLFGESHHRSMERRQVAAAAKRHRDRPDPELVDRLSEALALLPKEMQEQIVERLIAAITSTDFSAAPSNMVLYGKRPQAEPSTEDARCSTSSTSNSSNGEHKEASAVSVPLTAATLAALLSHYSEQVKKHSPTTSANSNKDKTARSSGVNNILVIPVHA